MKKFFARIVWVLAGAMLFALPPLLGAQSASAVTRTKVVKLGDKLEINPSENFLSMIASSKGVAYSYRVASDGSGGYFISVNGKTIGPFDYTQFNIVPSESGSSWLWVSKEHDVAHIVTPAGGNLVGLSSLQTDLTFFALDKGTPTYLANSGSSDLLFSGSDWVASYSRSEFVAPEHQTGLYGSTPTKNFDGTLAVSYKGKSTGSYESVELGPFAFPNSPQDEWAIATKAQKQILVVDGVAMAKHDEIFEPFFAGGNLLAAAHDGDAWFIVTRTREYGPFAAVLGVEAGDVGFSAVLKNKDGTYVNLLAPAGQDVKLLAPGNAPLPAHLLSVWGQAFEIYASLDKNGATLHLPNDGTAGPFQGLVDYRVATDGSWLVVLKDAKGSFSIKLSDGRSLGPLEKALGYQPYYGGGVLASYPWTPQTNARVKSQDYDFTYATPDGKHSWTYKYHEGSGDKDYYGYDLVIDGTTTRKLGFSANYDVAAKTLYWFELGDDKILYSCSLKLK